MPHRFFCPGLVETGSTTLVETEAHHLAHVLRHQTDDEVQLFNGDGLVATCRVAAIRKRDVELEVITVWRDMRPNIELALATAVPKGDRFDWLVEKATELGVNRLIPLTTDRSIVDPRTSKLDKIRQTVVASCKQSGRNHLMIISAVTRFRDCLDQSLPHHQVFIAHPTGDSLRMNLAPAISEPVPIVIMIGPEGGFSDDEVQFAVEQGAKSINLGKQILRIETAAIALAAKLLL